MSPKIFNPHFIVIAGPNGSGKSITSSNTLKPFGIQSFDWDKEFDLKWKKFDFDPAILEGVRASVNSDFNSHLELALSKRRSVAYETNFHSSNNFDIARKFRQNGFYNSLYFLALTNPELAINRVRQRVSKGGHNVSEATIRERFKKGLKYLDRSIEFYDRIFIYNSSITFQLQFVICNKQLIHKSKHLDATIMQYLPNLKLLLKLA